MQLVKGNAFECPIICVCKPSVISVYCQYGQLSDLPSGIYVEVLHLDFAFNEFASIPTNISSFKSLEYLNLSHNKLSYLDEFALAGLENLKVLDLSNNLFKDWLDIHKDAFASVPSLVELNLSHNFLGGFPDVMSDYPLKSKSLTTLFINNCSITNILSDVLLGLPSLEKLSLVENPLININTQIKSDSLKIVDLSSCNLQRIHSDAVLELSSLETLIISKNYQLKKFNCRSKSVKDLDMSHCNLESVPVTHTPNLTKVNFKGNHLREIPEKAFHSYPSLKSLDLSNNAIETVDVSGFLGLAHIQTIDLSFNTISLIHSETFITNTKLEKLNLSRNYLSNLDQLIVDSLVWLDMSYCEVTKINRDSLMMMPKLQRLNISRNLISSIPDKLGAEQLRVLDLSMCRISSINNLTLRAIKHLDNLNLAGNRITSAINPQFFYGVRYLEINDNPWYCDCDSTDFQEFYRWYYNILNSKSVLKCQSPEYATGFSWEFVCQSTWFTEGAPPPNGMWVYSLSLIVLMVVLCCFVISIKHLYQRKNLREREVREQEQDEARERLRQIHQRNMQYSRESINRNAPDPRELQTPPSYAEAVSMSRLNLSCNSLNGSRRSLHSLHSSHQDLPRRTKIRRKRRRSRQENKSNITETQSAASLSHANSEISNSEDEIRSPVNEDRAPVTESSL